jgi:hypothetical protein
MNETANQDGLLDTIVEEFFFDPQPNLKSFLNVLEQKLILSVLRKTEGNQQAACAVLGVKPSTLSEKIKRYRIGFRVEVLMNDGAPPARVAAVSNVESSAPPFAPATSE